MSKKFKILVPKPAAANANGTDVKLYRHNEVVDAQEAWQENLMQTFIDNGWAIEVKMGDVSDVVDVVVDVEADVEIKRARNEKGQLVGDDPETPEVNEAWEGGEAPKKKAAAKKTARRKTTKKT